MAANNPASRFDTNDRLKAEYRSAYVVGLIERARRAGVPAEALAYQDDTGQNWYAELVLRSSLMARGLDAEHLTGWPKVQALEDIETMLRLGLRDYCGIEESDVTGQLVPKMAKLHNLIQRQHDNANA